MDLMSDRALLGIAVVALAGIAVVGMTGFSLNSAQNPENTDERMWSDYRQDVGIDLGTRTQSENVAFLSSGVNAENFGNPDVTSVGADSDSDDDQELFASSDVDSGSDYYEYTTFGSTINSNLPKETGTYQVAVYGSGVTNEYMTYEVKDKDYSFDIENSNPLRPLQDVDVHTYAGDADISNDDTFVTDGGSTIALDANFTDDTTDSNIDGKVSLVKEYSVSGSDKAIQTGELSISSVDSNVEEVTMTFYADGDQIKEVNDADPTDSDKLNDGVEFGDNMQVEDSFEVHTQVEFDDSAVTNSTQLVTSQFDDADDDSSSADGSYGITAVSDTLEGR